MIFKWKVKGVKMRNFMHYIPPISKILKKIINSVWFVKLFFLSLSKAFQTINTYLFIL